MEGERRFSAQDYSGPAQMGHAVVLTGYDSGRGPNGAFRLINSHGTQWGDNGDASVDQDLFTDDSGLCISAFVASAAYADPDPLNQGTVPAVRRTAGTDLQVWPVSDEPDPAPYPGAPADRSRVVTFQIFNLGDSPVPRDSDWVLLYGFFKGYGIGAELDAAPSAVARSGILAAIYFTNDVADGAEQPWGVIGSEGIPADQFPDLAGVYADNSYYPDGARRNNLWVSRDLNPGESLSHELPSIGTPCSEGHCIRIKYILPENMIGEYYFKLQADAFNSVHDLQEQNDAVLLGDSLGLPVLVVNGLLYGEARDGLTPVGGTASGLADE